MRWLSLIGVVLLIACVSQSQAATLMGDWKLFDASNGTAPDSSGNGYNGVVYGNPTVLPGLGLHFDGANDYIEIPNTSGWNFSTGFSIDVKFCCTDPQPGNDVDTSLVSKEVAGVTAGYSLGVMQPGTINPNQLTLVAEPPSVINGPHCRIYGPDVLDSTWHEAVGIYDGDSLSLYLDGQLVAEQTPYDYNSFSSANVRIGYYVPAPPHAFKFVGDIGEVKIYDGAINVPEPSTFALLGVGAIGLLGYAWRRRKQTA